MGGEEYYTKLHSTVISSIDPEQEPTLFVILYNHQDYASEKHSHFLGSWLTSVMQHSRVNPDQPLQIKLLGVVDENAKETEAETEAKINTVLNDCGQTIISYQEKLLAEKRRVSEECKQRPDDTILQQTRDRIENLLNQKDYENTLMFT